MSFSVLLRGTITVATTAFLMYHFDNFSLPSFLFFGFCLSHEVMKIAAVYAFPILSESKYIGAISLSNSLYLISSIPRLLMAETIISDNKTPSSERLFWACFIFVLAMTLLMISETQKAVFMKFNKNVVTSGVFATTRNPEVLAEISILAAYTILVNSHLYYFLTAVVCLPILYLVATKKERSLEKEEEWKKYRHDTWMILPKIFGSDIMNIVVYIVTVVGAYFLYRNGGVTNLLKVK